MKPLLLEEITSGDLRSALVIGNFDEGLKLLQKNNYSLISLKENAMLRIQEGPYADISLYGNWVKEGVVYVPKKGKFLTNNDPINDHVEDALDAHLQGNDFYLTNEQVEKYINVDAVELNNKSIPTNRFNENEITNYAFGEQAEAYGNFLKENGIDEMHIWLADLQEKPFARKLWFWTLIGWSALIGTNRFWEFGDRCVRGVRKNLQESIR